MPKIMKNATPYCSIVNIAESVRRLH